MHQYKWKKLPKDTIIHWCRRRGNVRLGRLFKSYRYLVPRREREEKHKASPDWRVVTSAVHVIYWCKDSGCLKLVYITRPPEYLIPTDEVEHRIFIKRLHAVCQ